MDDLQERTQASLRKFKERADQLRADIGDARAATKVQMKAMIERLDQKYEAAEARFEELVNSTSADVEEELQELHDQIVEDFQTMVRTIKRRIR